MKLKNISSFFMVCLAVATMTITLIIPSISYADDAKAMRKLNAIVSVLKLQTGIDCRDEAKGTYLSQGNFYTYTTTLSSDFEYVLVGAGDGSTIDLDIYVYNENGNQVIKDSETNSVPIVRFRPRWTGEFKIKVKMYKGRGHSNIAVCYVTVQTPGQNLGSSAPNPPPRGMIPISANALNKCLKV